MPGGESSLRAVRLPVRLEITAAAARRRAQEGRTLVGCLALGVAIAAGLGANWITGSTRIAVVVLIAPICWFLISELRRGMRQVDHKKIANSRVEIRADGIACRTMVTGDARWNELTEFRWVKDGDATKTSDFPRNDRPGRIAERDPGEYIIEAAKLDRASETNEFGFYDAAEIQFDLRDFTLGTATRAHADATIAWLNGIRKRGLEGVIEDTIEVPEWLNTATFPEEKMSPANPVQATVERS